MRTHNWAFARGTIQLALVRQENSQTWPYWYAYPQDCLFIRRVFSANTPHQAQPFEERYSQDMSGRVIGCAVPQASAEYTRKVGDESIFDPAFVKAFSLALAADLAFSLTADAGLGQRILQKYTLALDEARRSNMTENFERPMSESAFVECR